MSNPYCRWCGQRHRFNLQARCQHEVELMRTKPLVVGPRTTREGAAAGRRFAVAWLRKKVLERDGYRCRYCGRPVTDKIANMDHVIPWPEGLTTEENLVTSCRPCNLEKGTSRQVPLQLGGGGSRAGGASPR